MNADEFLKSKGVTITLPSEHALVEMMEEYAELKTKTEKSEVLVKFEQMVRKFEDDTHIVFHGTLDKRVKNLISHYQQEAAKAYSKNKAVLEDCTVYFRSVAMLAESVGMAQTHNEKNARLRGLVELLESAIHKLQKQQGEELMHNWQYFSWHISDYPYRAALKNLQRENQELKQRLGEDTGKAGDAEEDL